MIGVRSGPAREPANSHIEACCAVMEALLGRSTPGPFSFDSFNLGPPLATTNVYAGSTLLSRFQIAGSGVASVDRYDIAAKASGPVTVAELRTMLGTLLAGRFKLTFHRYSQSRRRARVQHALGARSAIVGRTPGFHPSAGSMPQRLAALESGHGGSGEPQGAVDHVARKQGLRIPIESHSSCREAPILGGVDTAYRWCASPMGVDWSANRVEQKRVVRSRIYSPSARRTAPSISASLRSPTRPNALGARCALGRVVT